MEYPGPGFAIDRPLEELPQLGRYLFSHYGYYRLQYGNAMVYQNGISVDSSVG